MTNWPTRTATKEFGLTRRERHGHLVRDAARHGRRLGGRSCLGHRRLVLHLLVALSQIEHLKRLDISPSAKTRLARTNTAKKKKILSPLSESFQMTQRKRLGQRSPLYPQRGQDSRRRLSQSQRPINKKRRETASSLLAERKWKSFDRKHERRQKPRKETVTGGLTGRQNPLNKRR